MPTLPEEKGGEVVVNITEKDWLKGAIKRVQEQEKNGKLDPDLNLTAIDIFMPVGH